MELKKIAHIRTDFSEKFGIPRQSGLIPELLGKIVFEPEFSRWEYVRGIEGFSHLWLLWGFSEAKKVGKRKTVAPPRLGGKKRMGVFATRAPFRPNPIGLSSVRLVGVSKGKSGEPVLEVSGVDMLDNTPIYDIKPYLSFCDCHTDAIGGFTDETYEHSLNVVISEEKEKVLGKEDTLVIKKILAQDIRTAFICDDERVWGVCYKDYNIKFKVSGDVLTVCDIEKTK